MVTFQQTKGEGSGVSFQEKRKDIRLMTFFKVYKDEQILGFVIDLSKGGLKLWLNKKMDLTVTDHFTIEIQPPTKVKDQPVPINLNVVWKNPDRTSLLSEIGCQFDNLSVKQEEHVNVLLNCFS